ncbi:MAG: cation-translocating P-type ATPase, partial [Mycobacterium sp.]
MGTRAAESLDPSLRDGPDVANDLEVDTTVGLSSAEAARRLERDGPNELQAQPAVPIWRRLLAQFQDPLIYLLVVAVVISLVAWAAEGAQGVPIDALVITVVIMLNGTIGFIQESRAENAVAALQSMTAARSTVLRDGELRTLPSSELVRGDILVLAEGDAVGADGRLLNATALRVLEASLTGESEAVTKDTATLSEMVPLGDRKGMVFRGTAVAQGVGRAVITGTGMNTEMGAVAEMLEATPQETTPLRKEIAGVSKLLGAVVIVIAVVVVIVTAAINHVTTLSEFATVLLLGVSLAVAAVPEGLPTVVTVVLAVGVQRMAKRNAVVKKLASVETLGSATVIASDKTGTLTKNEMTIQRIRTASGEVELTGTGYHPEGMALTDGKKPADPALLREVSMVVGGGCLANDAQLVRRDEQWEIEGDPTEAAFLVAARKLDGTVEGTSHFERHAEAPFTSERKMMSTLVEEGEGGPMYLVAKGAPDVLLQRCIAQQVGDRVVPLDDDARAAALAGIEALSSQAFRTLGVAYRRLSTAAETDHVEDADERDMVYLGLVGIIDPPRAEVPDAIKEAKRAGLRIMMITGDHPKTAARIAEDLGIVGPGAKAVTGTELNALSQHQLRR